MRELVHFKDNTGMLAKILNADTFISQIMQRLDDLKFAADKARMGILIAGNNIHGNVGENPAPKFLVYHKMVGYSGLLRGASVNYLVCFRTVATMGGAIGNTFVLVLLACLGFVPQIKSQSVPPGVANYLSSPPQSSQIAPSESMVPPGAAFQVGINKRLGGARAAALNNMRGFSAKSAAGSKSPLLCFVPGIGWVKVPMAMEVNSRSLSANASTENEIPAGTSVTSNAVSQGSVSSHSQITDLSQTNSNGCAEMLMNMPENGVGNQNFISGQSGHAMIFQSAPIINLEVMKGNVADSTGNQVSRNALLHQAMGISSMPLGANYSFAGSGSENAAGMLDQLKHRAYVSPIKLRRQMRSAPDLETRIKLRELQAEKAKKSRSFAENMADRNSMHERLENGSANRDHSPRSADKGNHVSGSAAYHP